MSEFLRVAGNERKGQRKISERISEKLPTSMYQEDACDDWTFGRFREPAESGAFGRERVMSEIARMLMEGTESDREIGALIEERRKALGWNQGRLAREAGVSEPTVRKIEKGVGDVQPGKLAAVRAVLDIPAPGAAGMGHFPRDIELVQEMLGLWLLGVPESQRAARVLRLTSCLMAEMADAPKDRDQDDSDAV